MQKSLHVWKKKLIILISQSLNLAGKGHLKSSLRGETWDIEHKTNPIQLPRYMEKKHGDDIASTKVNFTHIAKIFELV